MSAKTRFKIPKKFYQEGMHPVVKTVGELKAALSELPDDLPFEVEFGNPGQVVVFNHGHSDCYCSIKEDDEDIFED